MMITTLVAFAALAPVLDTKPFVCPVMGEAMADVSEKAHADYNGARFWFCCGGCDVNFAKTPQKYLDAQIKAKKVAGDFMFDPVSGKRLASPAIIAETSDYNGIRFHFSSKANKTAFDKDPKKYGTMPKKEALYCPVASEEIPDYASAAAFQDHAGVRYYICCPGCITKMKEDPAKYAPNAKDHIKAPGVTTEKVR